MAEGDMTVVETLGRAYAAMVYRAAARQMGGEGRGAEDVTQAVFLVVMRKSREERLPPEARMAGWLLTVTAYAVREAKRAARTRRKHEEAAAMQRNDAAMNAQISEPAEHAELQAALDTALLKLGDLDREVVVRRYLRGEPVAQLAGAVGITENAASQRIVRALEKLRNILRRQHVVAPAAALVGVMIAESAKAAPATLAGAAGGTAAVSIAKGAGVMMKVAAVKTAAMAACAVLALAVGAGIVGIRTLKAAPPAVTATIAASTTTTATTATVPVDEKVIVIKQGAEAEKVLDDAIKVIGDQQKLMKNFTATGVMTRSEQDPKTNQWQETYAQDVTMTYELTGKKRWLEDCRNRKTPWTDGAAPFYIESYKQVCDGQTMMKMDNPKNPGWPASCWISGEVAGPDYFTNRTTGWGFSVFGWRDMTTREGVGFLDFLERGRKEATVSADVVTQGQWEYLRVAVLTHDGPIDYETRFWLDEKRDCALAKIEISFRFQAKDGLMETRKTSDQQITAFTEVGQGIFFPRQVKIESPRNKTQVDVSAARMNDPAVNDNTFKLAMAAGTNVFDDLGGDPVILQGTKDEQAGQLSEVVDRVLKAAAKERAAATQRTATRPGATTR